jgi:hypothetical protein
MKHFSAGMQVRSKSLNRIGTVTYYMTMPRLNELDGVVKVQFDDRNIDYTLEAAEHDLVEIYTNILIGRDVYDIENHQKIGTVHFVNENHVGIRNIVGHLLYVPHKKFGERYEIW